MADKMTYEEAKKHISSEVINLIQNRGNCITEAKIEACKLAIEALEKQIPKKPVDYEECGVTRYKTGRCSCCGEFVIQHYKHCPKCGQAISWEE